MDFIDSDNALVVSHSSRVPEGSYKGFVVRVSGTNGGGATALTTDLGRVRLAFNGEDIINTDMDILHTLNNWLFGFPEETSGAGAAFGFTFVLPVGLPKAPNNVLVTRSDQCFVNFTFALAGVAVAAPTAAIYSLYGIKSDGVQTHFLKLHQYTEQPTGAATFRTKLPVQNIYGVLIRTSAAANMDRVTIIIDGMIKYDAAWADAVAYSNIIHNVEAAEGDLFLPLALSNTPTEVLSDDVEVQITVTGAATVDLFSLYYRFTPEKLTASTAFLAADVGRRIQKKAATGQDDDVAITRILRSPEPRKIIKSPVPPQVS